MNKTLILILAICLVNVHAFVKRDAPQPSDLSETIKKGFDDIVKALNPDAVQAKFNELAAGVNDVINKMKATEVPKQEGKA